jgi:hypothetical protein
MRLESTGSGWAPVSWFLTLMRTGLPRFATIAPPRYVLAESPFALASAYPKSVVGGRFGCSFWVNLRAAIS